MRARRSAKAARERRLNRVHEAAEILRFAMSRARATKREARLWERHARFLKQDARHFRSQERRWIHSYIGEKELEWKQWDYFPNGCPYVLEEARIAEAVAGESRKLADEAGDLLRKAREAVSGSPAYLRRGEQRFFKAEAAFQLFCKRQDETVKAHKAILTRRTYPVFPTAGSACAARDLTKHFGPTGDGPGCCRVHRADALKLGWTEYPPHATKRDEFVASCQVRNDKGSYWPPIVALLAPEHPCEVPTVWYLSSAIRKTFNWH